MEWRKILRDLSGIRYHKNVLETIGRTPLVKLNRSVQGYKPQTFTKVELFSPGGSVKDRIGLGRIEQAEQEGRLKPSDTIVEATSGKTGMGLAVVAAPSAVSRKAAL